MPLNGDLMELEDYREVFDIIFKENVRVYQKALTFINTLPSMTLRRVLIRVLRSKFGTRAIARIANKNIKAIV